MTPKLNFDGPRMVLAFCVLVALGLIFFTKITMIVILCCLLLLAVVVLIN